MAIRIISKRDGFRRGGIEHSASPAEYPDDAFGAELLALLQAEPMLIVDLLPEPGAEQELDPPAGQPQDPGPEATTPATAAEPAAAPKQSPKPAKTGTPAKKRS